MFVFREYESMCSNFLVSNFKIIYGLGLGGWYMGFWGYDFGSIDNFGRLNSIFLRFVYCNVLLDFT